MNKHSKIKLFMLLLSASLLLGGCEKILTNPFPDEDEQEKTYSGFLQEMPKVTNMGANTFGCYINGELMASQGYFQKEGIDPSGYWPTGHVNGFFAERISFVTKKAHKEMELDFKLECGEMVIQIDTVPQNGLNDCILGMTLKGGTSNYSGSTKTIINIFFDKKNRIISGKFDDVRMEASREASGWESGTSQSCDIQSDIILLYLTDGRFDVKYGQNF